MRYLLAVPFLVLACAAPSRADLVEIHAFFGNGQMEFGPALGFARVADARLGDFARLIGPTQDFDLDGDTSGYGLRTGPLIAITPDGFGDAEYHHARGGRLSVEFDVLQQDGSVLHRGTFNASMGPYLVTLNLTSGPLRFGRFDRETADLLGIKPETTGGLIELFVDDVDLPYPAPERLAIVNGAFFISAVPEPTAPALLALACGVLVWRRRRATVD